MTKSQESTYDELRNTLSQQARILRRRWPWGAVALSLLGSLAFWCSQYVPRQCRATTVFERRDDAVLQDLVRQNSPFGFDHLKTSLALDTTGLRAKADAAMAVGLLPPGSISPDGALTPQEMQLLDGVLARVRLTAEARLTVSTAAFDMIELRVDANDAQIARCFVTALRDHYIRDTRQRISDVLAGTKHFFESELERHRAQAAASSAELDRYFADIPDSVARSAAAVADRLETLRTERERLGQESAALEAQIAARTDFLATGSAPLDPVSAGPEPSDPAATGLERALRQVEDEIVDAIVVRQMTPEHPSLRTLERKRDALSAMRVAAASQPATSAPAATAGGAPRKSQMTIQVELDLDALRRQHTVLRGRYAEVDERFQRFQNIYEKLADDGGDLQRLEERRSQDAAAANVWRQHLAQLQQVTAAESGQRGTQFALIEEPKADARALAPRLSAIVTVCSGVGLAAAVLLIALLELFDRSIFSPARVARITGVPVLECIGVIPTPRERRRRFLRAAFWTPTLAICLMLLVLTAGLAYASVEQPSVHRRVGSVLNPILIPLGIPPIDSLAVGRGEAG